MKAVIRAVARGDLAVLRSLIGFDVRERLDTEKGYTLLTYACGYGHHAVAQWLLEQGAGVDDRMDGGTALLIAIRSGNIECVKLLSA